LPTHVYQPLRNPPTWLDRLLVHPLDMTVALIAFGFGLLVAISVASTTFSPSKSMDQMPLVVVVLVAVFLTSGGAISLVGLNWSGDEVSKGWALERFGWLLSLGGFAVFAISVSWHYPGSVFSWGMPLALSIGCLLRFISLVLIERSTRKIITETENDQQ